MNYFDEIGWGFFVDGRDLAIDGGGVPLAGLDMLADSFF